MQLYFEELKSVKSNNFKTEVNNNDIGIIIKVHNDVCSRLKIYW